MSNKINKPAWYWLLSIPVVCCHTEIQCWLLIATDKPETHQWPKPSDTEEVKYKISS